LGEGVVFEKHKLSFTRGNFPQMSEKNKSDKKKTKFSEKKGKNLFSQQTTSSRLRMKNVFQKHCPKLPVFSEQTLSVFVLK
jgi:hypothetical protein